MILTPQNKILRDYLNLNYQTTAAFCISTIVLGVENSNLRSDLDSKETEQKDDTENTMIQYRLPNAARPKLYDLYLKPDLTTGLFTGEVIIHVDLFDNPKEIVLHSNQLSITKVTVDEKPAVWELDAAYELLKIRNGDGSAFTDSQAAVYIEFNGNMKNRIVGLYSSSYTGIDGTQKQIATSKFEPTYARQAFPCFDEPNMKAKFKVRLFKPKEDGYIALSNNPEESTVDADGGQIVTFRQTVPMSTYLVCFIVSDFISTDTTIVSEFGSIPFRVFATPAQLSKTTYAAGVGKAVIQYYLKYFEIEYPLPKLDMVAIPDFVSGAMEHWGLVTYRETALLYSDTTHSSANKQRVATVIAHELAHSWFGNLVTMNWWSDLWLNEGFASYIEYKGVDSHHPEWKMLDQFIIDDLHPVLSLDATLGSHPIIVSVKTPDEITSVFDTISYNKGASILRMLEDTVGKDIFQKGVKKYLQKYIYGNAITQNLLDELDDLMRDQLNVTEFMSTFTEQMGYPILDVSVVGDKYTFKQKRFLKDSSATDNTVTPYKYKWSVPITYVTDLGRSPTPTLFKYNEAEVTIQKPTDAKWIKFNYDQVGYYRVNYAVDEWGKLIEAYKEMSAADRTHLIEESFSIAEAGQLPYSTPLDLTKKLADEVDYVPWSAASSALLAIKSFLTDSPSETKLDTYISSVVDNAYKALTWNEPANPTDADHLKRLARVVVLGLACAVQHQDCLKEAKTRFDEWIIDTTKPLSQDLRGLIYRYGMKSANEATWNKLFDVFHAESDANEKLKLLYGLASVSNLDLLKNLLVKAEDETYVRSQDYFSLISYICANPLGPSYVWDYMRENWLKLVNRFSLNDRNFGRMVQTVTKKFATEERVKEMEEFFSKYPEAGAGATPRVQALETVNNNIKWLKEHKSTVEDWLDKISV